MNRRGLTGPTCFAGENGESLFQQMFTCKVFQVNPSLVTDTPGAWLSSETMQKHCIFSKTGRAREVWQLGDRGTLVQTKWGFWFVHVTGIF